MKKDAMEAPRQKWWDEGGEGGAVSSAVSVVGRQRRGMEV